jgi:hypothetical protein
MMAGYKTRPDHVTTLHGTKPDNTDDNQPIAASGHKIQDIRENVVKCKEIIGF